MQALNGQDSIICYRNILQKNFRFLYKDNNGGKQTEAVPLSKGILSK